MKKSTRISLLIASAIVVTLAVSCVCFLNIALYNDTTFDEDYQYARLCVKYPHITQWVDSIRPLMRDTIITDASGNRLFARYAPASNTSDKTAIIIHGYKSNSIAAHRLYVSSRFWLQHTFARLAQPWQERWQIHSDGLARQR